MPHLDNLESVGQPPIAEFGSFPPLHYREKNYSADRSIISVYLSSLPVAHLSDGPRRRLVVTGDSARIQDETTENSAWFFNVLGV